MTDTSSNPKGAGFFNLFTNGALRQEFEVAPSVSGASPLGTIMALLDYTGPGALPRPAVPEIVPAAGGQESLILGALTAGSSPSGSPSVLPGQVATVTMIGVCQVLVDQTTVAGETFVLSTVTPGTARTTTSPTTRTIGVCLQTVTVSAGTALCWALVAPGTESIAGSGGAVASVFTRVGNVVALSGDYAAFYDALGAAAAAQAASDPAGAATAARIAAQAASDPVGSAASAQAAAIAASDPAGSATAARIAAQAASDPVGSAAAAQAAAIAASDPAGSAASAQSAAIATAAANANVALYANPVIRARLH